VSGRALAADVFASQRDCSAAVAIFVSIASVLILFGCNVSTATTATTAETNDDVEPAALEIDAGVIFRDRASYLCVPLSRFGLSNSDNIKTIASTCEGVKPSLVRYFGTGAAAVDGVLFEFVSDGKAAEPLLLGLAIVITMDDGETRTITVSFLETQQVAL